MLIHSYTIIHEKILMYVEITTLNYATIIRKPSATVQLQLSCPLINCGCLFQAAINVTDFAIMCIGAVSYSSSLISG